MKIAVCISGHLGYKSGRALLEDVASSMQLFFSAINNEIDYFLHLSYDEKTDINIIQLYQDFPGVISKNIFQDTKFKKSIAYKNRRPETNIERTFKMFEKIKECNQLKKDYESKNNFQYDVVFRVRPDMIFLQDKINEFKKKLPHIQKSSIYLPKFPWVISRYTQVDFFAYGDSTTINIYSDTINYIDKYCKKGQLFHPETLLGYHLYTNKINVKHITPICFFSIENLKMNGFDGRKSKLFSPYFLLTILKYLYNSYKQI